ncbi:MAG: hypothetical protein HC888_04075, partial [Candidatus Competibacteraceae bacterium]|nr:hypothetical protein [Candidatus Competibacteraceae bacterium]
LAARRMWAERLDALSIPVFSTAAAKGVVDEFRPHAAGPYTGVGLALTPESTLLPRADLVVCLGVRPGEVLATRPFPAPAISVDSVDGIAGSDAFQFTHAVSDIHAGAVLDALSNKSWGLDLLAESLSALAAHMAAGPFLPAHAFAAMAERFGREVRIVMDTGYFCTIGEHAWRAPRADLCLLSGQGRYMGTGIPMALAAALTDPGRRPSRWSATAGSACSSGN